ncbi:MAG: glutamate synthase large subunit [Dehalococcoidia bacterium]
MRLLYRPEFEHDSCGVGFVANISGQPSHAILQMALEAVVNLTHRGAVSADGKTGDGAGVLTQIPAKLFHRELERLGHRPPQKGPDLAVGVFFLPNRDVEACQRATQMVEQVLGRYGLPLFGWREVPLDDSALGEQAASMVPFIVHLLAGRPPGMAQEAFQRALYLARKEMEAWAEEQHLKDFYIPSLSNRTVVYKGLLVAPQLARFYRDLEDPEFETALAVLHQRYSTNTFPNWRLAQPFRFLAHNGEINTLQGNCNLIKAREPGLQSQVWGEQVSKLVPIIQAGGSDSACLDNVLEALVLSGRDILHAMTMQVPEAWENMPNLDPRWRAFYEYHACISEPWDGPAALAFSDGVIVGATLDRNGLRPARYKIRDDGIICMASEVGVLDWEDAHVVEKGRLGPGQMIAVDTARGVVLKNQQLKDTLSQRQPYGEWLQRHLFPLSTQVERMDGTPLPQEMPSLQIQRIFDYTTEELRLVLEPMIAQAREPTGAMGDDTPLGVLATTSRLLYTYFKQKFAQVTNPAIDPLRETLVMSLNTYLGPRRSLLEESPKHAHLVFHPSPILTDNDLAALQSLEDPAFQQAVIPCLLEIAQGAAGLKPALERICAEASRAVDQGRSILVLSDRGVDAQHAPIPMLLATGAVHHHLIRQGKRMRASIVCESGEPREMHHMACLLGYGANAINPYLAFQSIHTLLAEGNHPELPPEKALANYKKTLEKQILKIMSKMGISALSGYHGAQIFEVVGLGPEVVDACFAGTPSQVSGIGFAEIAEEVLERHRRASTEERTKLEDHGYYRFRKEGEPHAFNPFMVRALHKAVQSNDPQDYQQFLKQVQSLPPINLRSLLDIWPLGPPVPLEEVQPVTEIVQQFTTASMSLGALSPEAHETLAIAMNRIGSKSNTGEGGEDPRRYRERRNGDSANSRTKQVASGRFGVTPEYLAMADELEIKMAQGSKPGEGGQLPGHKVVEHIALIRHTQTGVTLISPPPHHDIYSIEDLAQLIYDLKVANPQARVAVKLVSEAGVGTIAAGVAKAYADIIHISGHEGGTGASPLSSIKNVGTPWELGLAETQQVLVLNDLRGRVTLRTDGALRTARDVLVAAILGAEEYAFGTAALVAIGCQMARQCHLNTCPVGVATQDPKLREKFWGTPEYAIRYLFFVADELRWLMASLGIRHLQEVIGRPELLRQIEVPGHPKANALDLAPMLAQADPSGTRPRYHTQERNDRPGDVPLDDVLLSQVRPAIEKREAVQLALPIQNIHRTVGARIAGEIAHRYGDQGLPEGCIDLTFRGPAGQSFGAFLVPGVNLTLIGEANDYVGKGMHGGQIVIRPPEDARFPPHENVIMGNTVLYGATGGYLFAAGRAGERFAIRNSGTWAVVEGTGDHCCEYMTGGVVVVLGDTGRNFGAGMSGGVAYVLDLDESFPSKYNPEMVEIQRLEEEHDVETVQALLESHARLTSSPRAQQVLQEWEEYLPSFWKVAAKPTVAPPPPREEQRARRDAMLAQARGHRGR